MGLLTRASQGGYVIDYAAGSGLNFTGAGGPGYSIQISDWQSRTYIGDETNFGPEISNTRFISETGLVYSQEGQELLISQLPQSKSTLNLSFYNDTPVDTQNVELRIFDGVNIDNAPSGMRVAAAEIIHPDITYTYTGSGDTQWTHCSGAVGILNLSPSPGSSALAAYSGGTVASTFSDWYVAMSVSPQNLGSCNASLYFTLEYL